MRMVRALSVWFLFAAAALAGCGKMDWDWWKKPKEPAKGSAQSGAKDPNLEIGPEEALRLKDENKSLRDQLQDLHIRDQQLSEQLKKANILYEGQLNLTESLKNAPDERDKARARVQELTAEIELLRDEIARLKGDAAPSASQPAPTVPAPVVPPPTSPAPGPPVVIPPVQLTPPQTAPAENPPVIAPPVQVPPDRIPPATPATSSTHGFD